MPMLLALNAEFETLAYYYRVMLADAREYSPQEVELLWLRDDLYDTLREANERYGLGR